MSINKSKKRIINEYKLYSGILTESDDYLAVKNMIPGLQNAVELCKDSCQELAEVVERLEKISKILQNDTNSLHLPAESEFLKGRLRSSLHKILSAEPIIRKTLSNLESIG